MNIQFNESFQRIPLARYFYCLFIEPHAELKHNSYFIYLFILNKCISYNLNYNLTYETITKVNLEEKKI